MIQEFFGFSGYTRPAEGYMSWQHLSFVTLLMTVMTLMAVILGLRSRKRPLSERKRLLIPAALLINALQCTFVILQCTLGGDPDRWLYELPLFLCSIQMLTLPLAAFSRGRLQEAAMDFVVIFGLLGALMGTYFAGNNYSSYPVLCFDNLISGLTHSISGFASLYILFAGLASMKRKNIPITLAILLAFCLAAYIANLCLDYNYMFLMAGDGTPYDILYDLTSGHFLLYPLGVVALFLVYIAAFYRVFHLIRRPKSA